ncbi:histidine kinase [Thauera linaloolentis 47Lol = DSM 12138]|uniref:histidine kinase n=1 Tax=Thauera linaloolentis (strain DSM 12138 / JCM 21573 / CCUG 41526 / CIP 105981 / IAM 15112 / NBRC 102519 / 47Lol) TaxID=1123367 RepID=N6Z9E6_THAL4|nr:PhnD/SsuA/transferrin family substrate-binding protein [Thauera linaloolentis]ENO88774.1 histidine kinase [Thauera linaloolentis 47Lol = DSM 12138]
MRAAVRHCLLPLCFGLLAGPAQAGADGGVRDIAIGVFAYQGEQAATLDWAPVTHFLNARLPGYRFHLEHFDADSLRSAIRDRRVDLVITNPGYYVAMEYEFGLSRIATLDSPQALSPERATGSALIVRSDRGDLHGFEDLRGQRLAAIAPDAFGGYLLVVREMLAQGIDAESRLKEVRFLGVPMMQIVEAVQRGEVDAGVVRSCFLEQAAARGEIDLGAFRVLADRRGGAGPEAGFRCGLSTPLYPDWPIAVTRSADRGLSKQVAQALLAMPGGESGMAWTVPADYQPVRDLYRELRTGPYAYLRDITPAGLLRRYWPALLVLGLVLTAWGVHTVRVEHLVQRRTAELRASLRARDEAEARVRSHQEQMEHLSRLSILGELSGSLAHEINQPLTTIGNYARSLLRRQADGRLTEAAVVEACGEIDSEAERAGGIMRRIRDFARKRTAVREPVDMPALIDGTRKLIEGMLLQAPPIVCESNLPPGCEVLADAPQIQQVLLNLMKNAIDAGRDLPPGRQGVEVRLDLADKRLVVQVADRGCGLSPEQQAHLFEPFFTTKPDGLGLGLPICKTIIEAHGGRLWAQSNVPSGMCFSFSLPCHAVSN